MELKPCPFRVHGERKESCTIPGEYYYNETFMPCLKRECPCYHEDTGDAWCDRNGAYMKLNRSANDETMDDMISRAAAIDYLMTNMGWRDEDGYEVDDADEKRAIIKDLVNGIPAVDAVTVVRCRDCKHWRQEIDLHTHWVCTRHSFSERIKQTIPDFYCADGERRDSNGMDA